MLYETYTQTSELMKDKYPSAFNPDMLTPVSYNNGQILPKNLVKKGENIGVYFGGEKENKLKALDIARQAVQTGAKVTLFYRPNWLPDKDGNATDEGNSFATVVKDEQHLDDLINKIDNLQEHLIDFTPHTFDKFNKSFVISPYWNRHLKGIKSISDKTIGINGTLASSLGTDANTSKYLMERFHIENVDEFYADHSINRQILEDIHVDLNKRIQLANEKSTDLTGKKVLYLPELSLDDCMVARWRHEWPSTYLGESGVKVRVRGALTKALEKDDNGNLVWSKEMLASMTENGVPLNDHRISEYALHHLKNDIDWADIVVFGRTHNKFLSTVFNYAKSSGKLVGYEVDDLIFGPNAIAHYGEVDEAQGKPLSEYVDEQIKGADFVTTSTRTLAEEAAKLRGSIDNIYVVPNRLQLDELGDLMKPSQMNDKIRIGWAGGHSHIDKLLNMGDVFKNLYKRHGDNIQFVFKGLDPEKMKSPEQKEKLDKFHKMMEGLPFESHGFTPQGDWKDYYKDLRDLNLDIFIAPAKDDAEHKGKSELKYLEGSVAGAATIAHNIGGFSDAITNNVTGKLIDINDLNRNNTQFERAIDELIVDEELREKIIANAREDMTNRYDVWHSSEELSKIFSEQLRRHGNE